MSAQVADTIEGSRAMPYGPEFDRLTNPNINPETGPGVRPLPPQPTPEELAKLGQIAIRGAQQPPQK